MPETSASQRFDVTTINQQIAQLLLSKFNTVK